MIPYTDITDKADRRWTGRLLDRLLAADLLADELADLVGALQAVPRGPSQALIRVRRSVAGARQRHRWTVAIQIHCRERAAPDAP